MMVLFLISGIVNPLVLGYLHSHTESHVRATVESFASVCLRVLSVGIGLLFGYVSTVYSIFAGFLLIAAVCFVYLFIFRLMGGD